MLDLCAVKKIDIHFFDWNILHSICPMIGESFKQLAAHWVVTPNRNRDRDRYRIRLARHMPRDPPELGSLFRLGG